MRRRRLVSLGLFAASLIALGVLVGPGAHAAGSNQVNPTVVVQTVAPTLGPTSAATATATAAATATVTGTKIPLSAIPVGVARLSALRHGTTVVFSWHMLGQSQVRGFRLYAGKTRLNHGLIPVHSSLSYKQRVSWSGTGRFGLGVVFVNGQQITVRAH